MYDIIILGAGMAGLTAALYARRAGLRVLILEKAVYGGQIINTPDIENYPGCPGISGYELVQTVYKQAVTGEKAEIKFESAREVSLDGTVKRVMTRKNTYEAKAVIIASGARHRKLDCPGEDAFSGKGVSYCATCDGAFFKDRTVAVVGGGNTALTDASYLANLCRKVYLIHRRDEFRAAPVEVEKTLSAQTVVPLYSHVVEEIKGNLTVEQIVLKDLKTGETQTLACDGVFVAVGTSPDNELFRGQVEMDQSGYILAGEDCKTNLPGVFTAGDTRHKQVRQLVTAAADGAVSAEMAAEYLRQR